MNTKVSLGDFAAMKQRHEKIAVVTAYDAPSARLADAAGVDMVLVGDSAAMTVLGHDSTVPVTVDEMLMLTRAVTRGARRPFIVADMPFGSFQVSNTSALENAVRFVKEAGADAVKVEGAGPTLARVTALVDAGIPVMGHIGLTPQSVTMLGGYKAQGRRRRRPTSCGRRRSRSNRPAVSRWCSRRSPRRSPRTSPARFGFPPSASAPASTATVRCSCGTTSSASRRVTWRGSSSSTRISAVRC